MYHQSNKFEKNTLNILFMSDILESNAVITVNQFAKFYGFEVLPKMLEVLYQSDLNKLCQSNIKEYNGKYEGPSTSVFREKD